MNTVNEASTAYVGVTFVDKAGAAAQPSAATWRLDCLTTGAQLVGATNLSASGGTAEVTIPATATEIQTATNRTETKRLTVIAQYGSGADQVTDDFDFQVRNLKFVT
jgi:hypothetical protein